MFAHGWLELSSSPGYPGRAIGGRVHGNPNARKFTHASNILAVGGLTSFHGVQVKAQGLSNPEMVAILVWVMYSIEMLFVLQIGEEIQ